MAQVPLLRVDERPDFIDLQEVAAHALNPLIQESRALLTCPNNDRVNRVSVESDQARCAPDSDAFHKASQHHHTFADGRLNMVECLPVLGESSATNDALETLASLAVFPMFVSLGLGPKLGNVLDQHSARPALLDPLQDHPGLTPGLVTHGSSAPGH